MKSLYNYLEEFERLNEKVRSSNAFEYMIGIGEVSEKDIQRLVTMAVSIDTAVRGRGVNVLADELQLAEMMLEYYNPDLKNLYYKDLSAEDLEVAKEAYKHWKSIRDSLQESYDEKLKNIYIEE